MNLVEVLITKLKAFIAELNSKGVPLPMLRDPGTGNASVTLTMTVISFNTALLGQIGKVTHFLGDVDLTQANYLFLITLGAYLGRRMTSNADKKAVDLASKDDKENQGG